MYSILINLPEWLSDYVSDGKNTYVSDEARMGLVIDAARRNVEEDLGGPFGAAIFERDTGRVLSVGVNRVMDQGCSVLHAEVLAIMLAQNKRGHFTLSERGQSECELVTSCAPCAMCMGAAVWSGIKRMVCGARESDAFAVGFDEGPKPEDWVADLTARGIEVIRDVRRSEARALFRHYVDGGGVIYNPD